MKTTECTESTDQGREGEHSLPLLVRLPLGYCIARWLLNRWLRQEPRRVVPLLNELHRFAEVKLSVREYQACLEAWGHVIERMENYCGANAKGQGPAQ